MNFARRFRGRATRRVPGHQNNTERAYANHLELRLRAGEILQFLFEPIKVRLADKTFYEPDFLVVKNDLTIEIHEVKGTMRVKEMKHGHLTSRAKPLVEDDAAVKIKVAAETIPFVFKMVWRDATGNWREDEY